MCRRYRAQTEAWVDQLAMVHALRWEIFVEHVVYSRVHSHCGSQYAGNLPRLSCVHSCCGPGVLGHRAPPKVRGLAAI